MRSPRGDAFDVEAVLLGGNALEARDVHVAPELPVKRIAPAGHLQTAAATARAALATFGLRAEVERPGRALDQRDTAEEVAVRVVLDLGQPRQSLGRVVLAGLRLLAGQAVRADHPEVAVGNVEALDAHLALGPFWQIENLGQMHDLVAGVVAVVLPAQPLDRRELVVGDPEAAPRCRHAREVGAHRLVGVLKLAVSAKIEADPTRRLGKRLAHPPLPGASTGVFQGL
jgi:hypothetical protein